VTQLSFSFDHQISFSHDDFINSEVNQDALIWVQRWPEFMQNHDGVAHIAFENALLICGPAGCGKTHLAHIWAKRNNAVFIDYKHVNRRKSIRKLIGESQYVILEEMHNIPDEEALLHFFNIIKEKNFYLLITSRLSLLDMELKLADLRSRINAIPVIDLQMPDDELLRAILKKNFADRQLKINEDVVDFLLMRMERSFLSADNIVSLLDDVSLRESSSITIPFAKYVIEKYVENLDCI
jgi:chromosomal replication initiation ATPase DnaA